MKAIDLRLLRGAALPTVVVAAAAVVVCAVVAGGRGALAAALAGVVVVAFFTVSLLAVAKAGDVFPQLMLPVALATYVAKLLVLYVVIAAFVDARWMSPRAFAVTVIALTLVWTTAEVRTFFRQRILYVDPAAGERP